MAEVDEHISLRPMVCPFAEVSVKYGSLA